MSVWLVALRALTWAMLALNVLRGWSLGPGRSLRRPRLVLTAQVRGFERKLPLIRGAVEAYRAEHGLDGSSQIMLHFNYRVPARAPYPEHTWGFKLGSAVHSVKYYDKYAEYRPVLSELGISTADENERKFERFMVALETFKKLYGHLRVPRSFVVPDNSSWPQELRGLKLGVVVSSTRAKKTHDFPERVARLNEIGFVWDAVQTSSNLTIAALTAFKDVHGHVDVPKSFIVPQNAQFPKETWGMRLGSKISNHRYRGDGDEELRSILREVGVTLDYSGFDNRHWKYVYR